MLADVSQVIRAVPVACLSPIMGLAEASSLILLGACARVVMVVCEIAVSRMVVVIVHSRAGSGLRNALEPELKRDADNKYKV